MRLLNTWTGEFEWHSDPKRVRYAILSHVWRTPEKGGEQTYDDVWRIQADVKAAREKPSEWPIVDPMDAPFPYDPSGIFSDLILYESLPDEVSVIFSPESPLSDKIKGLCKVARDAGFDLVWNDTCCIDKSSSAELSEAINSMYEWYRLSDMCYVYLADVPDGVIPSAVRDNAFRWCRWHRRGWTLQELIAPERIEFLTCSWRFLGTKLGLAATLAGITSIDVDILLGRAPVHAASVAQRMSWAAERETTRVEDRAYSLMGLFDVHISPIYGEGTNALLRLQEEIIRTIPDQSIFAWSAPSLKHRHDTYIGFCLLASSPESFSASTVRPISPSKFASRLNLRGPEDVPPLDCTFAPQGARIRLSCVNLMEVRQCIWGSWQRHEPRCTTVIRRSYREADKLALLQCEDEQGCLAGLTFRSSDAAEGGRGSLVGSLCNCSGNTPSRIVWLSREVLANTGPKGVKLETAEVSLLRHLSITPQLKSLLPIYSLPALNLWPYDDLDGVPFSLSPDSVASLCMLGFTLSPLQVARGREEITLETTLTCSDGNLLHSIPLRLSLGVYVQNGWTRYLKIRFSSAARPNSSGLASGSAPTSRTTTDLEAVGSDSEQVQEANGYDFYHRYTLARFDFLIRPYPERPQRARLLRLSLERAPNGREPSAPNSPRTIFLVMEMSQEHEHITKSSTTDLNGDSEQPLPLTNVTGSRPKSPDAATTQCAPLEERMDALRMENSALREQATSQHAEMESKVAALASQNAVLASENAALQAQMAAMWQRLDALTAAVAPATSSPHTRRR